PTLNVEGLGDFGVPLGKRLVLALRDEAKVDQLHTCGGFAGCTSCRVQFIAGEPDQMSVAERSLLAARRLSGMRLSCQIRCDHAMSVRVISCLAGSRRKDAGPRPDDAIQPPPQWVQTTSFRSNGTLCCPHSKEEVHHE